MAAGKEEYNVFFYSLVSTDTQGGVCCSIVITLSFFPEKFDDEAELNLKELKHLHKKEVEKKGVDNLTTLEACKEVLGKGHTTLKKDDKKSRAEMQSGV